jgi:hypothetical protein
MRCAAVGLIATSIFAWPAIGAERAAAVPDLSGLWAREFLGFDPPESGPGPIANTSRLPSGQSSLRQLVGDYANPILKPEAAEIVKKRGEISRSGTTFPDPGNQCWPQPTPYILWQREIQLVQQRDEVIILYMQDHQVRHVRMDVQHPAKITPTWHGDSVGHYEGGVLVVDTHRRQGWTIFHGRPVRNSTERSCACRGALPADRLRGRNRSRKDKRRTTLPHS